jgi:hypothetical protein
MSDLPTFRRIGKSTSAVKGLPFPVFQRLKNQWGTPETAEAV